MNDETWRLHRTAILEALMAMKQHPDAFRVSNAGSISPAMLIAGLAAAVTHLKVSPEMQRAGERAVDGMSPGQDGEESVAFRAMLDRLAAELREIQTPQERPFA